MKKYMTTILLLFCLSHPLKAQSQSPSQPLINFSISTEDDIPAESINLHFELKKQSSTLDSVNKSMQAVIQTIRTTAIQNGLAEKDIQIQDTLITPSEWLFGKDYKLSTSLKITLDPKKFNDLSRIFSKLDPDLQFKTVSFTFPKDELVWQPLLKKAIQNLTLHKVAYEKALSLTLMLHMLNEQREDNPYYPELRFNKVQTMATDTTAPQSDPDTLTVPTKKYRLRLDAQFEISPKNNAKN